MNAEETQRGSATNELFQILRDGAPRTRSELATMTGFSRSTVAQRVEALMRQGLVRPVGDAASTGGRPSTQFVFNNSGRVVLAVDVGASHVKIAISDLRGETIAADSAPIEVSEGPEAVLSWVERSGIALIESAGYELIDLVAVGVGLPGPVEHSTGRPINPPIMPGWNRYDVAGRLRAAFGASVLVDNDVNIMALGERELAWPDVDNLMFVKVATSQDVIELVRRGNLEAIQAVRQAGRDVGEVLTACVSLINPSVIVIGGSMAQAGEHLIAGVREMVYTRSMPLATEHLQITQSRAGADAAILGASVLAIQYAFSPERVEDVVLSRAVS